MLCFERAGNHSRYRLWTKMFLVGILVLLAVIITINMVVDAYGIVRSDFSLQFREPNKNFIKQKYLLENKGKFDCYLFGSSRVNGIDVKKIAGVRCYNMTYSEGVPQEHLENIRFMLQNGVQVRHVIIGLDDFSYRVDPNLHAFDLLRQPYPVISHKSWLMFYSEYFVKMKQFIPNLKAYLRQNVLKKSIDGNVIVYDMYDSGRSLCLNCDEEIERDPAAYRNDPKFKKPFHYDGDNMEKSMAALRDIVRLAKEHNIRLTVFINPIHHTTYLDTNMPLLIRFKKELAAIMDYYDFSGLNSITTDNYYYHETSHYREKVGDMMLQRMFGLPSVKVPADFGILVTRINIESHLAMLRRQLMSKRRSPVLSEHAVKSLFE